MCVHVCTRCVSVYVHVGCISCVCVGMQVNMSVCACVCMLYVCVCMHVGCIPCVCVGMCVSISVCVCAVFQSNSLHTLMVQP